MNEKQWQGATAYYALCVIAGIGLLVQAIKGDTETVTICLFLVVCTMAIVRSIHAHN